MKMLYLNGIMIEKYPLINDNGFDIFDTDTVVVSGLSTSVNALASSFTVGFQQNLFPLQQQ